MQAMVLFLSNCETFTKSDLDIVWWSCGDKFLVIDIGNNQIRYYPHGTGLAPKFGNISDNATKEDLVSLILEVMNERS